MNGIMTSKEGPRSVKGTQDIAEAIRAAITTGEQKPGQRLVECQLSELYGVKRNKIREALRKLEHDGFVTITPNVGAEVAGFSRVDIEQTYDLIAVLDGLAIRLATPFITEEQIRKMEKIAKKMEDTDEVAVVSQCNIEFHTLLDELSQNKRLIEMVDNLRSRINVFGYSSFHVPGQTAISNAEHRKIIQAMKDRDPVRAEQLMRDHLIDARNRLIKWMYRSL
jgi:DNA-binding GntR family transcriptional regulator